MGEFIFTVGYGGALIVVGVITHFLLKKMEREGKKQDKQTNEGKVV